MASSSVHIGDNSNFKSKIGVVQPLVNDYNIPKYESVPRHLWTTKCVSLCKKDGVPMAEGICHNMKSYLVIETDRPLGETHVVVQKEDEYFDDWRYSVQAWPIMHVFYNEVGLYNHE